MNIVIAPDSFKGSNTSERIATLIEAGVLRVFPDAAVHKIPIADGGEGTVDALLAGVGGTRHTAVVTGPLGLPVAAAYGVLHNGTGVIEVAASSGLPLVPEGERDPWRATSYGVGELLLAALDRGCRRLMIGLGGSATNDGGAGMLQALGVRLLDHDGQELPPGGGALANLAAIDTTGIDPRVSQAEIVAASDVTSPLWGELGASHVFGPQKGADKEMVLQLDAALQQFAQVARAHTTGDPAQAPGAGAAGGIGYGLLAFCGAQVRPGITAVMDAVDIDRYFAHCDLVITGEGKLDGQSLFGKVPVGIAERAKRHGLPVLAIVGDIGDGAEAVYGAGIDSIMSTVNRAMPLSEAMALSAELTVDAAERALRMLKMGMEIRCR